VQALDPTAVSLEGTTLIEASAGTGKTYTITTLVLRLLVERRLQVGQILVVTFTQAAAAELRDRIRRRLTETLAAIDHGSFQDDPALTGWLQQRRSLDLLAADRSWLQQAVRDFDEAPICTIHAFCQRVLAEHAFESKAAFELQLVEQQTPLLEEITYDYWAMVAYAAEPELVRALRRKANPEKLLSLVHKALRDPAMPVLPDAPAAADFTTQAFHGARDRAAEIWLAQRSVILAELCVPGRLNQNSHPNKQITERWVRELDALPHASPLGLPPCAAKLTDDALRKATRKQQTPPRHRFFAALTELVAEDARLRASIDERVLALRRQLVDYARAQVAARRKRLGEQSFDDLLLQLRAALRGDGGRALARRIAGRYPAALIDEFQDTDPIQYDVFVRVYGGGGERLFLIGDPKQAIYGFRGADIFAYMQAARAAGRSAFTLDVNHRSDPRLVTAVNTLFERARLPFLFAEIRFEPVRAKPGARERMDEQAPSAALQLLFVSRSLGDDGDGQRAITKGWGDRNLPRLVAREIVVLLRQAPRVDGEPLHPRHIAVLCRTNNQAKDTARELARLGVPTVLDGDSSVFETEMAEELSHVLWAVARPSDARKFGAALASSILGVSGEALYAMRSDDAGLEPWLERLARWNLTWHERGFIQMWHQMLQEAEVRSQLLRRRDGERRLTNLLHLAELLHEAAVSQHLGPLALLHWLHQMRSDPQARGALVTESAQLRLEHDEHALKLTTIHRSKGLEYPVVFCPFLWADPPAGDSDVCFHDREDSDRFKLDIGSPEHAQHARAAQREALAENLRLLYVALTRARHRCYVVWGRFNHSGRSPLGYLLHQPPGSEQPSADAIDERLDLLSDAQLQSELQALCAEACGTIGVREFTDEEPAAYRGGERARGELSARASARVLRPCNRMSSFSRLTADAGPDMPLTADERFELDEEVADPARDRPRSQPDATALTLAHFPAGSGPGSLIHGIYERIDFQRSDPGELDAEVARNLRAFGLDAALHQAALVRAIDESLRTPLDDARRALTLSRIGRAQKRAELEFTLATAGTHWSGSRLAEVFERHAAPACAPGYTERLRKLGSLAPAGFLKGFIDLVFHHEGRFYIVDYKSNRLGDRVADYGPARLQHAMQEHHYFLQYHLYAVALHRHLGVRVPSYDFERCFGGVYYLFLRGMAPEHPFRTGVFFDRPSLALLEELADALGAAGSPA
jgi:exodeoxyribonuclease V beta subunit